MTDALFVREILGLMFTPHSTTAIPDGIFASAKLDLSTGRSKELNANSTVALRVLSGPKIPDAISALESLLDTLCPPDCTLSISVLSSNLTRIADENLGIPNLDKIHDVISGELNAFIPNLKSNLVIASNFRLPPDSLLGEDDLHFSSYISNVWGRVHSAVMLVCVDKLCLSRVSRSPGKIAELSLRHGILPISLQNGWRSGSLLGLGIGT